MTSLASDHPWTFSSWITCRKPPTSIRHFQSHQCHNISEHELHLLDDNHNLKGFFNPQLQAPSPTSLCGSYASGVAEGHKRPCILSLYCTLDNDDLIIGPRYAFTSYDNNACQGDTRRAWPKYRHPPRNTYHNAARVPPITRAGRHPIAQRLSKEARTFYRAATQLLLKSSRLLLLASAAQRVKNRFVRCSGPSASEGAFRLQLLYCTASDDVKHRHPALATVA